MASAVQVFQINEDHLPATLSAPPMTDEAFEELCAEHPDLFFEVTGDGEIIIMPPTYPVTGIRNSRLSRHLDVWAECDGRGFAFDSPTGFALPNGARRSADGAWILKSRVAQLDPASRERYWHLCPDFVIELQSASDRPRLIRERMEEWIANGAQLVWLIDPRKKSVAIYRPDGSIEVRTGAASVRGEGPVEGFDLDLTTVWNPLGE